MDPVSIGLIGGTALISGIANLFGGDDEQDKIDAYLANIEKMRGKYVADVAKRQIEMYRRNEAGKKSMLTRANQKAAQVGFDPVASSYANEEGLDNALQTSLAGLDKEKSEQLLAFDQQKANVELNRPEKAGWGEKLIAGGLEGANLGSSIANMLATPGTKATKVTDPNIVDTKGLLDIKNTGNLLEDTKNVITPFPKSEASTNKILNFAEMTGQGKFDETTFDEYMSQFSPKRYRLKNLIG